MSYQPLSSALSQQAYFCRSDVFCKPSTGRNEFLIPSALPPPLIPVPSSALPQPLIQIPPPSPPSALPQPLIPSLALPPPLIPLPTTIAGAVCEQLETHSVNECKDESPFPTGEFYSTPEDYELYSNICPPSDKPSTPVAAPSVLPLSTIAAQLQAALADCTVQDEKEKDDEFDSIPEDHELYENINAPNGQMPETPYASYEVPVLSHPPCASYEVPVLSKPQCASYEVPKEQRSTVCMDATTLMDNQYNPPAFIPSKNVDCALEDLCLTRIYHLLKNIYTDERVNTCELLKRLTPVHPLVPGYSIIIMETTDEVVFNYLLANNFSYGEVSSVMSQINDLVNTICNNIDMRTHKQEYTQTIFDVMTAQLLELPTNSYQSKRELSFIEYIDNTWFDCILPVWKHVKTPPLTSYRKRYLD